MTRTDDDSWDLASSVGATATEYVPGIVDFDPDRARTMAAPFRRQGFDLDMPSLIYTGPRRNVMEYLAERGWTVDGVPGDELLRRAGLPPRDREQGDPLGEITYVSGTRP